MVYAQKIVSGYRYSLQGNDMMRKREKWHTPRLAQAGRTPFVQGENTALMRKGRNKEHQRLGPTAR